ncbi:MFS multidrug transporter-like protein [Periconia macrospinosa]|uniref:MFS multidrug transporter-like protein n=1 Tax=Periconia macrospinosa TaxID=97972 RepID=A0A2V1DPS0_9PLEO|nr:MFS multidrug transporter-like protein [Periconia macrospinosa]
MPFRKTEPANCESQVATLRPPLVSFESEQEANWEDREKFPTEKACHEISCNSVHNSIGEKLPQSNCIITWDGTTDPENPHNWTWKRKFATTILVSLFTFLSTFTSTMVTPVLGEIGDQFNIPEGFSRQLVMSIFLLGYTQGPFILAPLSEIYGRVTVLQSANLIYLVFNTACGFARTKNQILVFRFLSGIGGSAPQALCNGVLADTWPKEERGKGQAVYGLFTWLGPCIAPICGAYISSRTTWRWTFWSTSLVDVAVQILALVFLNETFAPIILGRKAKRLSKQLGHPFRTEYDSDERFTKILRKRLMLPLIMMFTHPAVQAPSIYLAYMYGVLFLVLSTFPLVWENSYHQSKQIASFNYLSLCVGLIIGLQISHRLMDWLYAYLKARKNLTSGVPEFRVPPMLLGGILCPIGLLIYGWTVQHNIHWIVPNIGCVILAIGLIIAFQCAQAYVVDAYDANYVASAAVVGVIERILCGFSFPLFATQMYGRLGLGWGNTLLAFVTLVLAMLGPVLLWFFGARIRALSTRGLN